MSVEAEVSQTRRKLSPETFLRNKNRVRIFLDELRTIMDATGHISAMKAVPILRTYIDESSMSEQTMGVYPVRVFAKIPQLVRIEGKRKYLILARAPRTSSKKPGGPETEPEIVAVDPLRTRLESVLAKHGDRLDLPGIEEKISELESGMTRIEVEVDSLESQRRAMLQERDDLLRQRALIQDLYQLLKD